MHMLNWNHTWVFLQLIISNHTSFINQDLHTDYLPHDFFLEAPICNHWIRQVHQPPRRAFIRFYMIVKSMVEECSCKNVNPSCKIYLAIKRTQSALSSKVITAFHSSTASISTINSVHNAIIRSLAIPQLKSRYSKVAKYFLLESQ